MLAVMSNASLLAPGWPLRIPSGQERLLRVRTQSVFPPTEGRVESSTIQSPPLHERTRGWDPLPDKQPVAASDERFRMLREQFEIKDKTSVKAYLRRYPFLLPLILEAKTQVIRIFGNETRAALQVSVDPSDWSSQLYIVIPTRLNAEAALELFDKLDKEWWLEVSERARFRMNFVPEFI